MSRIELQSLFSKTSPTIRHIIKSDWTLISLGKLYRLENKEKIVSRKLS